VYSIVAVTDASPDGRDELVVTGPRYSLRYAAPGDASRLLEIASNPAVTRWFSWGLYTDISQPESYIASLPARREAGELLDFVIVDADDLPVGVTGLSEVARRDRRATVGSWLGQRWWGSGANAEAKAMIAALAFRRLGFDRLTAWANTRNGRSQRALERVGFRREGVLAGWHRHGEDVHDVVIFGLLRAAWEHGPLHDVPVTISGTPPSAFVMA